MSKKKKLNHLKPFKNNNDQERLNSLYDDIKYLSLDLTDNKIGNNLWVSNNWDVKRGNRGNYKVTINLSITDMTNDLVEVLDMLPNSKDSIKTAEWFRKYHSKDLPNLSKYKRKILFDFIESVSGYVSYNDGEISISVVLVDDGWNDSTFYVIINMDFGIESTIRLGYK